MNQVARTSKQIGAILKRQRRLLKLTQSELGAKAKLRQATISELEAGEPGASLSTVFDVLAALDLEAVVRPRSKGSPRDIEDIF
jgi:HTH-type transcriptional regulator/antitoxin HipB